MDLSELYSWGNNNWILASEKLPLAKKPVLIGYYGNSSDDLVVRVGWYDGTGAWYLVGHANHDTARLTTVPGYWAEIPRIRNTAAKSAIATKYARRLIPAIRPAITAACFAIGTFALGSAYEPIHGASRDVIGYHWIPFFAGIGVGFFVAGILSWPRRS